METHQQILVWAHLSRSYLPEQMPQQLPSWAGGWSVWCARRGWESKVRSALRREGKGETLFLSMTICSEDKRKAKPDSFQRCMVIGQEAMNISWNIINSSLTLGKNFLQWEWSNTGTGLKEAVGSQSLDVFKTWPDTALSNLIWSDLLWAGDWTRLPDVPSNPNYFMILCLYDTPQTNCLELPQIFNTHAH